jgi:hypothetical protein
LSGTNRCLEPEPSSGRLTNACQFDMLLSGPGS